MRNRPRPSARRCGRPLSGFGVSVSFEILSGLIIGGGNSAELTFNLPAAVDDTSGWTFTVDLIGTEPDSISGVSGNTITFALPVGSVQVGSVVTVTYNASSGNARSTGGIPLSGFTNFPVVNPL